jgi:hypothetical protein
MWWWSDSVRPVIPGLAEGESPEPMNTELGGKTAVAPEGVLSEACSWVPGSMLRVAPE